MTWFHDFLWKMKILSYQFSWFWEQRSLHIFDLSFPLVVVNVYQNKRFGWDRITMQANQAPGANMETLEFGNTIYHLIMRWRTFLTRLKPGSIKRTCVMKNIDSTYLYCPRARPLDQGAASSRHRSGLRSWELLPTREVFPVDWQ